MHNNQTNNNNYQNAHAQLKQRERKEAYFKLTHIQTTQQAHDLLVVESNIWKPNFTR